MKIKRFNSFNYLLYLNRTNVRHVIAITLLTINSIYVMSDSKTFIVPDSNAGTSGSQFDAATLLALMNNNSGFGNGNWLWIIFLFFLYPFMRNGGLFGGNGATGDLGNLVNNDAGRELLMQAITNNGSAIQNLANMMNTSTANIQQAICGLNTAIGNVSAQVGLSGQQIINAIQQGNMNIAQQLSTCCCTIRESITKGFSDVGYAIADKTCQINQNILAQTQAIKDSSREETNAIIARLDGMEKSALNDRIRSLEEAKSTLMTQLNLEHQNAITGQQIAAAVNPINSTLGVIQKEIDEIKCKQPATITTPYSPVVTVPNCVAAQMGLYGIGVGSNGVNGGFWY